MDTAPINLVMDWMVVWDESLWCKDNLPGTLAATRSV